MKEGQYKRLAWQLRDQRLTNFKLFAQAFFQILGLSLWRIGHPPPAKQIKDHSLFIGHEGEDKVTWEMGAAYDLSKAFKDVNVELHITLRPSLIRGGPFPYVCDFVIWSQWSLPKPHQKNAARVINELYFKSYELPLVIAEAINFIPTEEKQLETHIDFVAKQIERNDLQIEKEKLKKS